MTELLNEAQSKQLWTRIIAEAENLPALPDIVNKVLEHIDSPQSNTGDFQEIISNDPVLTAKVLKMSNSAYYGFPREIVTLSEAVIILGLETLKSLVIAASAYKSLNQNFDSYGLSKGDLWKHSLAAALSARLIAKHLNCQETEKFFVTGLLHDIGKILLSKFLGKYIEPIKTLVRMREISFDEAERQVLSFNHCDVGSELSKYWRLPEVFADVTRYHHTPYDTDSVHGIYIKVVHIADIIAYRSKTSGGIDRNSYKLNYNVLKDLKIGEDAIESIIPKVHSSIREFEKALL